jgi:hypothetical protein
MPTKSPKKAKKRVGKPKAKNIFRVTKLEIYGVGAVLLLFGWVWLSAKFKTPPSVQKTAEKKAIVYKGKVQN